MTSRLNKRMLDTGFVKLTTLLIVLFTALSTVLAPTSANASFWSEQELVNITIEAPFVELRSGPGRGFPIVHVVEQGEQLTVVTKRTAWFKVIDKRGNQGWIHQKKLVQFSFNQGALATEEQDQSDFQNRHWEGGVAYGELEDANFYRVSLAYAFSPVISSEISLGKASGSISDSDLVELTLLAQPFPEWLVSPYLSVGGGLIETTPISVLADAESRRDTLISGALGAKYYLTRNFVLRAEYKYALALTDRDDNETLRIWTLGFSAFF